MTRHISRNVPHKQPVKRSMEFLLNSLYLTVTALIVNLKGLHLTCFGVIPFLFESLQLVYLCFSSREPVDIE